ncbi:MAG: P-loop NTPase fold protein [Paludibacteraceae bacterium]|nr:P-loop NTPase fold protein [Paludibacteraceae bacterium]
MNLKFIKDVKLYLPKLPFLNNKSMLSDDYQTTLTPISITKDKPQYKTVLNIAHRLKMGDALNIALTGPYGSGKSSILRTLKNDFPNFQYLSISLATLKSSVEKESDKEVDAAALNSRIEYSILQQLEYKETHDTLCYSRFKRIYYKPCWKHFLKAICIVLYFICLLVVFKPSFLRIDEIVNFLNDKAIDVDGVLMAYLILLILTIWGVYRIIKYLCNSKLNRLNLVNGEIELQEETSVLNKHLDEIIYFFQATKYNVVIIEDLDRFNNTDIFLKLREINQLLNQSKAIGRKIFFIYAVRDDLFVNEDRAKFFDYITTVIPIINSSNSADKLIEELKNKNICDCLSKEVIENIAFFIDDMRLLKNIVNEYAQYKEKLDAKLNQDNLFAMIVYKNYYPKDFADLHKGEGIIYKCLHMKDFLQRERNQELDREIEEIKKKIKCAEETHVLQEKELRLVYVEAYRQYLRNTIYFFNINSFKVGGTTYKDEEIAGNESIFNTFIERAIVTFDYFDTRGGLFSLNNKNINVEFSQIEKMVNKEFSYVERLDSIRKGEDKYREKISELELLRNNHYMTPIKLLLEGIDMQKHELFREVKVPKMLESFLKEGLINEDYFDYISFFFGNSISRSDHDFVLELKLDHSMPYNYPIEKVDQCVKNIPLNYYDKECVLNIQIVDYICQNIKEKDNLLKLLSISKIIVNKEKWDFLLDFYRKVENPKLLFEHVAEIYEDDKLWMMIEGQKEDDLYEAWLRYVEFDHSTPQSKAWIKNNYSFISRRVDKIGFDTIKRIIEKDGVVFLSIDSTSIELLNFVTTAHAYAATHDNVSCAFANCRNERVNEYKDYPLNLSIIKNCEDAGPICDYIYNNLENALVDVFTTDASKKESQEIIIELLQSEISEDTKRKYLNGQVNKISLDDLDKGKWDTAIELDLFNPDWRNIYLYLMQNGNKINENLKSFIENHIEELENKVELSQEEKNSLSNSLLSSSCFDIDTKNKIKKAFDFSITNE